MADKSVGELIAAQSVTPTDLFVLEQNGTAKKLTGQTLENWLVSFADGHGGIQSVDKIATNGLVDTYRITLADTTTFDFIVNNGRGINSITKTGTAGLVDTYTISFNDNTSSTFTVTNGAKGDKGDNTYTWIKYASQQPTEFSHSFGDVPDNWIGIYAGASDTAPTDWQEYSWFQIKGEKGDTGAAATVISNVVEYQTGESGTIIPSGAWGTSIPVVAQGKYLWTRVTTTFNSGSSAVSYSVSRMGLDGSGSVVSVANISPDENGNVPLTAEDLNALSTTGGYMAGSINMNGQKLNGLNAPTEDDEAATKGSSESFANKQITDRVISGSGKNLIDPNQIKSDMINTGVVKSGNTFDIYTITQGAWRSTNSERITLKAGRTYTLSATVHEYDAPWFRISIRDSENRMICTIVPTGLGRFSASVTPNVDTTVYFSVLLTDGNGGFGTAKISDIMLEEGSVATEYEPYYKSLIGLMNTDNLVWENASPNSSIELGTISIPMSQYRYALLVFRFSHDDTDANITHLVPVNQMSLVEGFSFRNGYHKAGRRVNVNINSTWFSDAYGYDMSTDGKILNQGMDNSKMVPLKIYGIY